MQVAAQMPDATLAIETFLFYSIPEPCHGGENNDCVGGGARNVCCNHRYGTYHSARPLGIHPYITTKSSIEPWACAPGYASTVQPARLHWGCCGCLTDDGQGRFHPPEMQ
jgi:hypothetical protein